MNPFTALAIYLTIWWTVLFAVLPLGVRSHAEAGTQAPGGGDPSSPVNPRLKQKFLLTTLVSAVIFAVFYGLLHFGILRITPLHAPG